MPAARPPRDLPDSGPDSGPDRGTTPTAPRAAGDLPLDRGPAFLLLHFFGGSQREWQAVAPALGDGAPVHALDLPGFGDAALLAPEGVGGMANYVERWHARQRVGDCVLVGHSMSAKVAAVIARRAPPWLRGLVLMTASPPGPEPMAEAARARLRAFDGSRTAAAEYVDGNTAQRLPDGLREAAIDDAMRASPAAWRAWIESGSREDWSERIGVLRLPTLLLAGARDASLGTEIQTRHTLPHFPQARLAVLPGGHLLPLENPQEVAQELAGFRRGLAAPPGTPPGTPPGPSSGASRRAPLQTAPPTPIPPRLRPARAPS